MAPRTRSVAELVNEKGRTLQRHAKCCVEADPSSDETFGESADSWRQRDFRNETSHESADSGRHYHDAAQHDDVTAGRYVEWNAKFCDSNRRSDDISDIRSNSSDDVFPTFFKVQADITKSRSS